MEPNRPSRPATELMFTIEPPLPASIMARAPARMPRKTPVWLTAKVRSQSSIEVLTRRPMRAMPALLTTMSSRP